MDLNDIPQEKKKGFPEGVSEVTFGTEKEMTAFLHGFSYADDIDTESGTPFKRGREHVVRVRVGDFGDDEDFDLDDEDDGDEEE